MQKDCNDRVKKLQHYGKDFFSQIPRSDPQLSLLPETAQTSNFWLQG